MHGSVVKRGPSVTGGPPRKKPWAFILESGEGANGKRRQVWRSGFATKRAAQDALQEEIRRRLAGMVLDVKRLTVGAFLQERWLPGLSSLRPSTVASYEASVRLHLRPRIGGSQLRELSTPDVNELLASLVQPKSVGGAGLAPPSVRIVHATLRTALRDAVRWGLVPNNVATGAQLPRRSRPEMRVWSADQLRTFLAATAADPVGPLYALIATTGLRRGEATGLRWQQVDLERGRLLVDHQLVYLGYDRVVPGEPKTRRGHRVLSLDEGTVSLLRRHERRQAEHRAASGHGDRTYVFTRPDFKPYTPDFVTKHFGVLVRRTGLPVIRLHDLRHTHATLGLAAGIPAKIMADRLGHSSVLLTLDTYSHVSPVLDADAANLIARLIAGPDAGPR